MAAQTTEITRFKKRDKVIATRGLPGVPEGTRGKVKLVDGLTWFRYWVQFDNDVWMGTVPGDALVRAADWEAFKTRRAEEASRPKVETPAAAVADDAAAPATDGATSKVPAHLLERAKKARERMTAAG